jgi:hypothetical protein
MIFLVRARRKKVEVAGSTAASRERTERFTPFAARLRTLINERQQTEVGFRRMACAAPASSG